MKSASPTGNLTPPEITRLTEVALVGQKGNTQPSAGFDTQKSLKTPEPLQGYWQTLPQKSLEKGFRCGVTSKVALGTSTRHSSPFPTSMDGFR